MNSVTTPSAPDRHTSADDEAVQLLQLAARLYAARGNLSALREALTACSDWFSCCGVLASAQDDSLRGADALEALAGRVTHCAEYRQGACGGTAGDALRRARCAALASHLHEAAAAHRRALQAQFFDQRPPTWILDRDGRVQDANASAKALTAKGDDFRISNGCLVVRANEGGTALRRILTTLAGEARFSWPVRAEGSQASFLLHPLAGGDAIAVTFIADPSSVAEVAPRLSQRLGLTPRQGELAAHLLAGHALTEAARAMGISRNTANEHLVAVLQRTGATDRKALLSLLRAVQS